MERDRLAHIGSSGRSRLENLRLRADCLRAFRKAMKNRGVLEIETPVLIRRPGLELHLDVIPVEPEGFLATSPEYQMKRLIAGGLGSIYYLGKAFRRGERGPHHNPEFTMAEWYRVDTCYEEFMDDVSRIVSEVALEVLGTTRLNRPGRDGGYLDLAHPWEVLTVTEAFREFAGIELREESREAWLEPDPEAEAFLRESAENAGVRVPRDATWEEVFFRVFVERVEPGLDRERPVILTDWPLTLAALSAIREERGRRFARRFEIFAGGMELANAFEELVDAKEQRRRLNADIRRRKNGGKPVYEIDEAFLSSLDEGLPKCVGIAMGVDRLVMLLTGASDIREVTAFTAEEL